MSEATLRPFFSHIAQCQSATLPGPYRQIRYQDVAFGWVDPRLFEALTQRGLAHQDGFDLDAGICLEALSDELAAAGYFRPHGELFDVIDLHQRNIGRVDRGLIPLFGCEAHGVHLNGLVDRPGGLHIWVAHRAPTKRLDAGKLDHLAAGGISSGFTPQQTIIKEAQEEAGIPVTLTQQAKLVSTLRYNAKRQEGLRRDTLYCYDLQLPPDFTPIPVDGEVAAFELLPLETVFRRVRDTRDFKFNVNIVLIDLFMRVGLFSASEQNLLRRALVKSSEAT